MSAPGRVILLAAASPGLRIADAQGGVDWLAPCQSAGDRGLGAFRKTVARIAIGRRSCEQVLGFGAWPCAGKATSVLTRRPLGAAPAGVVAEAGAPDTLAARWREEGDTMRGGAVAARRALLRLLPWRHRADARRRGALPRRRGGWRAAPPRGAHRALPDRAAAGGALRRRERAAARPHGPIAQQSRGLPAAVATGGPAARFPGQGRSLWETRQDQRNLACMQCRDDNAGRRLRGDVISHAIPTGFPAYRLEWNTLGSLHRRLRACQLRVRARLLPLGAPECLALELFLADRARGMPLEAPGLRR